MDEKAALILANLNRELDTVSADIARIKRASAFSRQSQAPKLDELSQKIESVKGLVAQLSMQPAIKPSEVLEELEREDLSEIPHATMVKRAAKSVAQPFTSADLAKLSVLRGVSHGTVTSTLTEMQRSGWIKIVGKSGRVNQYERTPDFGAPVTSDQLPETERKYRDFKKSLGI